MSYQEKVTKLLSNLAFSHGSKSNKAFQLLEHIIIHNTNIVKIVSKAKGKEYGLKLAFRGTKGTGITGYDENGKFVRARDEYFYNVYPKADKVVHLELSFVGKEEDLLYLSLLDEEEIKIEGIDDIMAMLNNLNAYRGYQILLDQSLENGDQDSFYKYSKHIETMKKDYSYVN